MQLAGKRAPRNTSRAATEEEEEEEEIVVVRSFDPAYGCGHAIARGHGITLRQLPGIPASVIHRRNVHPPPHPSPLML